MTVAHNRQRAAEQKRLQAQQLARAIKDMDRHINGDDPLDHAAEVMRMISDSAAMMHGEFADRYVEALVERLVDLDGLLVASGAPSHQRPLSVFQQEIKTLITNIWERGWQPRDVMHAVKKDCSQRSARLAICLLLSEAKQSPQGDHMPPHWREQIDALPLVFSDDQQGRFLSSIDRLVAEPIATWRTIEPAEVIDALHDAMVLFRSIRSWRSLAVLCDPPSRWSAARNAAPTAAPTALQQGPDAPPTSTKTLATIRALLAKAEGTEFAEEAEAFAAKAQEMMTKYSIDAAMLDTRHGNDLAAGVKARRFHIDQPYAKEKVILLSTVGSINNVRIVFDDVYAMATALGFDEDLDVTDMLYTSLLVQASRALTNTATPNGHASSPSFRRAFWLAFAQRVGERLREALDRASAESEQVYGNALVPVLQERKDAIDHRVTELFGQTRSMKTRQVDAAGWHAGRNAADSASLGIARGKLKR
jgi:Protein of unknown function (DUF2786)